MIAKTTCSSSKITCHFPIINVTHSISEVRNVAKFNAVFKKVKSFIKKCHSHIGSTVDLNIHTGLKFLVNATEKYVDESVHLNL